MQFRRPGNGHNPGLLTENPGECDLSGGRLLALSDCLQQIDQRAVGFSRIRRKTRDGITEVGVVKSGSLVDLACKEAFSQRAKGNKRYSKLFECGNDFRFRLPPPKGVFTLKCRDWLNGV